MKRLEIRQMEIPRLFFYLFLIRKKKIITVGVDGGRGKG